VVVWFGQEQLSDSIAIAALKQLSEYLDLKNEGLDFEDVIRDFVYLEGTLMPEQNLIIIQ
jgi:hypothetical protein